MTSGAGKIGHHVQRSQAGPFSYTGTEINSKWMKDLHVRQEPIKVLEANTGGHLRDFDRSNLLLDGSPLAGKQKER